jgi:hypothetical protein
MIEIQHLNWKSLSQCNNWALIGLLFVGWFLLACQQPTVNVSEAPAGTLKINTILVLSFKDLSDLSNDRPDVRSPVSGRVFISGEVAGHASDLLTDNLVAWLRTHTRYTIITSGAPEIAGSVLSATGGTVMLNREELSRLGQEMGADAVVLNYVYRFKERVGKGFSAASPASVAFDMHLIRLMDGRIIWSANFDETQQSLGQNLFQLGSFISRGGRWISAEEMAGAGLKKILEKFPKT